MNGRSDLARVVEHVFRHSLTRAFSESFFKIFMYYIGVRCNGDIFEVFLVNPKKVYDAVVEVYGEAAARCIFRSIYIYISRDMILNMDFNLFLERIRYGGYDSVSLIVDIFHRLSTHLPEDR